jgi:hypothetical protein
MKRIALSVVIVAAVVAGGCGLIHAKREKSAEPFYRKYLVAGNTLDDQIREQERRVEAQPESADLRNDFANLLAERRFVEDAQRQYETALELDRSHFLAAYNLGLLLEAAGKPNRAISAYRKTISRSTPGCGIRESIRSSSIRAFSTAFRSRTTRVTSRRPPWPGTGRGPTKGASARFRWTGRCRPPKSRTLPLRSRSTRPSLRLPHSRRRRRGSRPGRGRRDRSRGCRPELRRLCPLARRRRPRLSRRRCRER